jgi:DNA-binding response OmpR family regulator
MLSSSPDLVLLDIPSQGELEHLREIRQQTSASLLLIGPARSDKLLVAALERGADDYVQRPFRTDELMARIRAQLRRLQRSSLAPIQIGGLQIDPFARTALFNGAALALTPAEFNLLSLLAAAPNTPHQPAALAEQIWGRSSGDDLLAATVARLRNLIELRPEAPGLLCGDQQAGYWLSS